MYFNSLAFILSLSASTLALPPVTRSQQCQSFLTVSDPGFYASGSIPTADFPDDPSFFENQILEFQPTFTDSTSQCTLFGNFERGFPVRVTGNSNTTLDVYQRHSSTDKKYIGSFASLALNEDGDTEDIVSSPIGTVACSTGTVFEFQLALKEAGAWASIAFSNDDQNGFSVLAC